MTERQAIELIQGLEAAYRVQGKISRESAAIYAADLLPFDYGEAREAIARIRISSEFFPSIAKIVDELVSGRMQHLPDWTEAWLLLTRYQRARRDWRLNCDRAEQELTSDEYERWVALGSLPLLPRPQAPPPEVMEAIEVVGGISVVDETDNIVATRAHFRDAYARVIKRCQARVRHEVGAMLTALELAPGPS